jgi:hypothetical protein
MVFPPCSRRGIARIDGNPRQSLIELAGLEQAQQPGWAAVPTRGLL